MGQVVRLEMSDKLKLLIMFALKFENESSLIDSQCKLLESKIANMQLSSEERKLLDPYEIVKKCTSYAGKQFRSLDVLYNKSQFNSLKNTIISSNNNFEKFEPLIFKICKLLD